MGVAMPNFEQTEAVEHSRRAAQAWVARFAPLVMDDAPLNAQALRSRLAIVESLRQDEAELDGAMQALSGLEDADLVETVRQARGQLGGLEQELRRRLAQAAPGDPAGVVDLDALQERLDDREARLGLGLPPNTPAILRTETSPSNPAAALGIGVFGFGWTSFTAFHATMMIGGMSRAFGWGALALLPFYGIFFLVGFGMLAAAYGAACRESIELNGHDLTVIRKLGPFERRKTYRLAPNCEATIGSPAAAGMFTARRSGSTPQLGILLVQEDGKPLAIGQNCLPQVRTDLCKRINAYLQAQR